MTEALHGFDLTLFQAYVLADFPQNVLLFVPLGFGLAGIFMLFPPRKPNAFYGYRSRLSRKTEETWRFAQKYSARSLAAAGLICLLLSFAQEHLQIFNFRGTEGFWYGFLPIILLPNLKACCLFQRR